ncbi:MAG: hypothetical protein EBR27_09200 [Betaproteobacteria bacterium]|nr:hypothetical protein [Betaproteobacteria bacterium]
MKTLLDVESTLWRETNYACNAEDKKSTFEADELKAMASIVCAANMKANKMRRCLELLMQLQAMANEILEEEMRGRNGIM